MFRFLVCWWVTFSLSAFGYETKIVFDHWKFKPDQPDACGLGLQEYPATVPGVVHLDLMQNGLTADFYKNLNEHSAFAQALERQNWIYTTNFELTETDLKNQHLELVFEGLDTYAWVYLNDSLILKADNMFRTWKINVKNSLRVGENKLRIRFMSPLNYHENTFVWADYELPSGNETVDIKVSAYTRKAAYQFGWDWGPRFVTCGIWRPCYIKVWNDFEIADFYAETEAIDRGKATMQFHFTLQSDSTYNEPFEAEMMGHSFPITLKKGQNQVDFYHEIVDAKLWYPNGHGDQPIYAASLNLMNAQKEKVYTTNIQFAVRTLELVNEKDSIGTSFYFKVNGKPIFMKGANYIPQDLFLPRVTNSQTETLLELVQQSGMNMVRVWGGGIYESDFFYDQCDQKGILVWQDFMFANSMYPATPDFHQNVAAEIEDNVKRLRNHPCIALWCGNNEIEVAWHNWGWQKQYNYSPADSAEIWENYKAIFHELIPSKLKALDPLRAYIPSSPQSNWGKPENFNHGAMHYWGVWHGKEPVASFKTHVGRFMVEYGFQSYPDADLLSQYLNEQAFLPDSPAFKNLQKSYIGDGLIRSEVKRYFGDLKVFTDWLRASQYVQGQALKTAILAHRLKAPHCMGTLFWQLNDCWPGASWSVIDYHQQKKRSFYEVERWFSPTIAVFEIQNDTLVLFAHTDIPFAGEVSVRIAHHLDGTVLQTETLTLSMNALETKKVWQLPLGKWKKGNLPKFRLHLSLINHLAPHNTFEDLHRFNESPPERM